MVLRIDRNEADWGHQVAPSFFIGLDTPLFAKYGLNKERFFSQPGFTVGCSCSTPRDRSSGTIPSCDAP